jgi:phospholipase D1/2
MQMMYETIYKALVEVGLEEAFSPQDFLNFFCLGNRESVDGFNSSCLPSPPSSHTPQVSSFLNSVVSFMQCILQLFGK